MSGEFGASFREVYSLAGNHKSTAVLDKFFSELL